MNDDELEEQGVTSNQLEYPALVYGSGEETGEETMIVEERREEIEVSTL